MIFGAVLFTAASSYCQEKEDAKTKTIDGNVLSVDWEKSILTVKWFSNSGELEYEETSVNVPGDIKISKGGDTVGLMDLEVGDHVIIEYYGDIESPMAKGITVEE